MNRELPVDNANIISRVIYHPPPHLVVNLTTERMCAPMRELVDIWYLKCEVGWYWRIITNPNYSSVYHRVHVSEQFVEKIIKHMREKNVICVG